jgi:ABC-type Fe3+ transport system permease subunit
VRLDAAASGGEAHVHAGTSRPREAMMRRIPHPVSWMRRRLPDVLFGCLFIGLMVLAIVLLFVAAIVMTRYWFPGETLWRW